MNYILDSCLYIKFSLCINTFQAYTLYQTPFLISQPRTTTNQDMARQDLIHTHLHCFVQFQWCAVDQEMKGSKLRVLCLVIVMLSRVS